MRRYETGFILEQALGHVTHTKNLEMFVPRDPEINAHWGLVDFSAEGLAGRIPLYSSNWTVRAGVRAHNLIRTMTSAQPLDVLFIHTQVPAVLNHRWMQKIPTVVSLDATPLQYDELGGVYQHAQGPAWLEDFKYRLNRRCFETARRLVVWSDWTRRGLIDGYSIDTNKIVVLPPGVDVKSWMRPTPRNDADGPLRILFVGGDLYRKGGQHLLDAFRALKTPNLELHLVTKTALDPEPGLFVYHDMQPNSQALRDLYHRCDIFVLPTLGDCLPMVLSEAGAAGLATISTGIAGIPEIVRHGETGLIVPPNDLAALIEALRTLVNSSDLRRTLTANAIVHVSKHFDSGTNAERLLAVIKDVANSNATSYAAAE